MSQAYEAYAQRVTSPGSAARLAMAKLEVDKALAATTGLQDLKKK